MTCRRKKTKCSGEVPCRTCREKGVECEGLTPRKRPKRLLDSHDAQKSPLSRGDSTQSGDLESPPPIPPSRKRSAGRSSAERITDGPHRPTTSLLKLRTGISHDSGYGSSEQIVQHDTALSSSWQGNLAPTPSSITTTGDSAPVSPTSYQDWSFMTWQQPSEGPRTETTDSAISASVSTHSASQLISAAEMLEMQAMSLRLLAAQCPPESVEGARRQTIDGAMYDGGSLPSNLQPSLQPHSYDDLSPFLSARGFGSGVTPRASEYNSWWNVEPTLPLTFGSSTTEAARKPTFEGSTAIGPSDSQWPVLQSSIPGIHALSRLAGRRQVSTAENIAPHDCSVPVHDSTAGDQSLFPLDIMHYDQT